MGCILSSVACCFCNSAAGLCCSFLPACKSSSSSRIMFSLFLILTIFLSAIALIPNVKEWLTKIPALCTPFKLAGVNTNLNSGLDCDAITGFGAVYRVCFATVMFYLFFCLVMIRVHSSKDVRAKVQNGFWFFKFLAWFGILVGAFFIPVEGFTQTWMVIGIIGGGLYILIQLILFVDFAHSWNTGWISAYEETDNKFYCIGLVFCTGLFNVLSITGVVLLYIYYGYAPECTLNKAFISCNLIFCIFIIILSVLPKIQENMSHSGLLQSSLISTYVIFLTWSAMTNGQDPACNPTLYLNHTNTSDPSVHESVVLKFNWHVAIGLCLLIFSVIYSSIRSSSHTAIGKLTLSGTEDTTFPDSNIKSNVGGQEVIDNEEEGVAYDYSMFHFLLLLATLYAMVMLTNWLKPENDLKTLVGNSASLWVRIVTSWVCLLLYTWTLVAPSIFPDREF